MNLPINEKLTNSQLTVDELRARQIQNYTNIGFCQPKFYTTQAWYKATKCMKELVRLGHVEKHNFGYGQGKYRTTEKGDKTDFNRIYEILVNSDFKL